MMITELYQATQCYFYRRTLCKSLSMRFVLRSRGVYTYDRLIQALRGTFFPLGAFFVHGFLVKLCELAYRSFYPTEVRRYTIKSAIYLSPPFSGHVCVEWIKIDSHSVVLRVTKRVIALRIEAFLITRSAVRRILDAYAAFRKTVAHAEFLARALLVDVIQLLLTCYSNEKNVNRIVKRSSMKRNGGR